MAAFSSRGSKQWILLSYGSRRKMKSPLLHAVKMIKDWSKVAASPSLLRHLFLSRPFDHDQSYLLAFRRHVYTYIYLRLWERTSDVTVRVCERGPFCFLLEDYLISKGNVHLGDVTHIRRRVVEQIIINFGREALREDIHRRRPVVDSSVGFSVFSCAAFLRRAFYPPPPSLSLSLRDRKMLSISPCIWIKSTGVIIV